VRPYIHLISGDNPMQAEECSTIGLRSNLFCRTCMVGGSQAFKASEAGYPKQMQVSARCGSSPITLMILGVNCAYIQVGVLRTVNDTIACIKKQYDIAFTSKSAQELIIEQRNSGVKDSIAQPLLESLVERRRELQKTTSLSLPAITQRLRSEYAQKNLELRMNPLLGLRGM
jgi:hypothetical protein